MINITLAITTAAYLVSASIALAQVNDGLRGIWRQDDGSITVRIDRCASGQTLCAAVINERLKPGDVSLLNQIVVRDMKSSGKQSWAGKYVIDGQATNAKVKRIAADRITFKICALPFLCETLRFARIDPEQ